MKHLVVFFLIAKAFNSSAQQLVYRSEAVDTITISSNFSYYHFDNHGTTSGVSDLYRLVYNQQEKAYILELYQRKTYKGTFKPKKIIEKIKVLDRDKKIDSNRLSYLLTQLEKKYVRPEFSNLGLSEETFREMTGEKQIRKIAKQYHADWYFKPRYSSKDENELLFKGSQHPDTLNKYLENAFDTTGYAIITDVDERFVIRLSTVSNTYSFTGKLPNTFKQPFYLDKGEEALYCGTILNLSINRALTDLLPDTFSHIQNLKPQALIREYLVWYLKRNQVID